MSFAANDSTPDQPEKKEAESSAATTHRLLSAAEMAERAAFLKSQSKYPGHRTMLSPDNSGQHVVFEEAGFLRTMMGQRALRMLSMLVSIITKPDFFHPLPPSATLQKKQAKARKAIRSRNKKASIRAEEDQVKLEAQHMAHITGTVVTAGAIDQNKLLMSINSIKIFDDHSPEAKDDAIQQIKQEITAHYVAVLTSILKYTALVETEYDTLLRTDLYESDRDIYELIFNDPRNKFTDAIFSIIDTMAPKVRETYMPGVTTEMKSMPEDAIVGIKARIDRIVLSMLGVYDDLSQTCQDGNILSSLYDDELSDVLQRGSDSEIRAAVQERVDVSLEQSYFRDVATASSEADAKAERQLMTSHAEISVTRRGLELEAQQEEKMQQSDAHSTDLLRPGLIRTASERTARPIAVVDTSGRLMACCDCCREVYEEIVNSDDYTTKSLSPFCGGSRWAGTEDRMDRLPSPDSPQPYTQLWDGREEGTTPKTPGRYIPPVSPPEQGILSARVPMKRSVSVPNGKGSNSEHQDADTVERDTALRLRT